MTNHPNPALDCVNIEIEVNSADTLISMHSDRDSFERNAKRSALMRTSRRKFILAGSLLMLVLWAPSAMAEDSASRAGYQARYEITWHQPATTYNMTVYFDGNKKLCSEQLNAEGKLEIKQFFDLEKETMVTLYPQVDTTTALEQEINLDQFVWRMLESQKRNFTSLGKKKIGQWACDGWKQTLDGSGKPVEESDAVELWLMSDSGCGVLSKQMGEVTMSLKEFIPKSPAASTFELPDGCKVEK